MPLVSCITINHCGKWQAIFVLWLVNFPDSSARLGRLSEPWQHCEQQVLERWKLLTSLPILSTGAARFCLPGASSQKGVLARSAEQKLGLRASACLERDSHLLTLTVRNIAGKSSELTLQHHLVAGLWLPLQQGVDPASLLCAAFVSRARGGNVAWGLQNPCHIC